MPAESAGAAFEAGGRQPGAWAAWLCDDLLVVSAPVGLMPGGMAVDVTVDVVSGVAGGDPRITPPFRWSEELGGTSGRAQRLMTVDWRGVGDASAAETAVEIGSPGRQLCRVDLATALTDLRSLARERLAGLEPGARAAALRFLVAAGTEHGIPATRERAARLRQLREGLRERLPLCGDGSDTGPVLTVDALLGADETNFYVAGRCHRHGRGLKRLTAVSPEGWRVELLGHAHWDDRPGDDNRLRPGTGPGGRLHRFCAYATLEVPSLLDEGWLLEGETLRGEVFETAAPPAISDAGSLAGEVMAQASGDELRAPSAGGGAALSFVEAAVRRHHRDVAVAGIDQFGQPPGAPDISVVIRLREDIGLVEHQLAQFASDADFRSVDLVYVLGSPGHSAELRRVACDLSRLYPVAFRVVAVDRMAGDAAATNLAAGLARGRLLVLMHSHVLPDEPGWLTAMAAFHDRTPAIGALGAKVLYEDDSIHHAGIHLEKPPGAAFWHCSQPWKGLHRDFSDAAVPSPVPAVGGSCMMVAASAYHEVGGLGGLPQEDDYAVEVDLCVRLLRSGRQNWYLPDVVVYFLEERSLDREARQGAVPFTAWLRSESWDRALEGRLGVSGEAGGSRVAMEAGGVPTGRRGAAR